MARSPLLRTSGVGFLHASWLCEECIIQFVRDVFACPDSRNNNIYNNDNNDKKIVPAFDRGQVMTSGRAIDSTNGGQAHVVIGTPGEVLGALQRNTLAVDNLAMVVIDALGSAAVVSDMRVWGRASFVHTPAVLCCLCAFQPCMPCMTSTKQRP